MTQNLTLTRIYLFSPQCEIKTFQRLSNHLIYQIRTLTTLTPFFTQENCLSNVFEARIFQAVLITILKIRMSRDAAVSRNNWPISWICVFIRYTSRKRTAEFRWVYVRIDVRIDRGTDFKKAGTHPRLFVINSSIEQIDPAR